MAQALLVGFGGFIGSVLRYWLSELVQQRTGYSFPAGTLAVNVVGCLAIGLFWSLAEYGEWFGPQTRLFFTVGILGGFTTFSAFGYETFVLLHDRQYLMALANVAANVFVGIAGVVLGWMAGKALAV
jgi:CrcB protein